MNNHGGRGSGRFARGGRALAAAKEFSALNARTRETIAAILDGDRDRHRAAPGDRAYAAESTLIRSEAALAPPPTLCRRCRAYHASKAGLCSSCAAVPVEARFIDEGTRATCVRIWSSSSGAWAGIAAASACRRRRRSATSEVVGSCWLLGWRGTAGRS